MIGPGQSTKLPKTPFGEIATSPYNPQTGWIFSYNINPQIAKITELNGGSVTHEDNYAKIETGTDPNGVAFVRTVRPITYAAGQGGRAIFTYEFDTPQENSQQLIGAINFNDGWAFGYNGLRFGILKRNNGVDEWIYQDQWNINTKADIDPLKGNVYEIAFQYLGYGMQFFSIENTNTGDLELVHVIKYSGKFDQTSIRNPNLPLAAGVANLGNTTNIVCKATSASGGLYASEPFSFVFETLIAYERIVTIGGGVETKLFALRNPATWQGKDNRLYIFPRLMCVASDGNKPVIYRVYAMPTITNPVWTKINDDVSPLEYDEVGTWVPNGELQVFSLPVSRAGNEVVDLSIIDAEIQAEQVYIVTAESANSSDVVVSLNFKSRM